jgi:hypothetical protein
MDLNAARSTQIATEILKKHCGHFFPAAYVGAPVYVPLEWFADVEPPYVPPPWLVLVRGLTSATDDKSLVPEPPKVAGLILHLAAGDGTACGAKVNSNRIAGSMSWVTCPDCISTTEK